MWSRPACLWEFLGNLDLPQQRFAEIVANAMHSLARKGIPKDGIQRMEFLPSSEGTADHGASKQNSAMPLPVQVLGLQLGRGAEVKKLCPQAKMELSVPGRCWEQTVGKCKQYVAQTTLQPGSSSVSQ